MKSKARTGKWESRTLGNYNMEIVKSTDYPTETYLSPDDDVACEDTNCIPADDWINLVGVSPETLRYLDAHEMIENRKHAYKKACQLIREEHGDIFPHLRHPPYVGTDYNPYTHSERGERAEKDASSYKTVFIFKEDNNGDTTRVAVDQYL